MLLNRGQFLLDPIPVSNVHRLCCFERGQQPLRLG